MVRIHDIAQALGLSESTVSRVLNQRGRISEETRQLVLEYAEQVGYRPNRIAQNLKSQSSKTVGVLLPDINNAFYSLLFTTIGKRLQLAGLQPILFDTSEESFRERDYVEYLRSSLVDGMIIATSGSDIYDQLPQEIIDRIVFLDNKPNTEREYSFVGTDNVNAARELTDLLVDLGHKKIATIIGPMAASSATERFQGYLAGLEKAGLSTREEWIIPTNFLYQDAYEKSQELFAQSDAPTAIVAQNNVLAYAAIRVVGELGLQVPEDISICCFDHIDVYGFIRPKATSMNQPLEDMAKRATELLLRSLNNKDHAKEQLILPARFSPGETSGKFNNA